MGDEGRQYVMDTEVGNNFVELLGRRARKYSDKIAVTFLLDGEVTERSLTYAQLDLRSRATAVRLLSEVLPGDRVLLLQPPGLEFVIAFFGCLYAGVVAVAAYPPRNARHMSRIEAMLEDAQARTILTSEEARTKIEPWLGDRMVRFRLICSEKIGTAGADAWQMPVLRSDTLALLQYTSGSTGEPRGVMVTHGNIMANEEMIRKTFGHHSQSSFASWLPIYHDMGLIGNLLQPLYIGTSTVLMPPASFLQKPVRWLSAISRFRARVTGAPNFAFDLCARAVTEEQKAALDLSCLELLYSGSEPIDARSLDRFAATFRDCGLRREALYPCYGMAEATLLCTGGRPGAGPRYLEIDAEALASGHNQPANGSTRKRLTVVSCGESVPGQDLHIVEPSSRVVMRDGSVGEIWLRGAHITAGYWRNEADTRELCNARLASGGGRFLRTGDLGFVHHGELYVTGRIKDVIITRGRNHYPQDIERSVEVSHPALQPNSCAAFAITVEGTEQLAVAVELRRAALKSLDTAAVIGAVRSAVMEIHELAVCAVALLKPLTLPKTSSGKLQRGACRALFLDGRLAAIAEWRQNHALPAPTPMPLENTPKSSEAIRGWLVRELASRINSPIEELDVHAPFSSHGLDSVASVQLTTALENWLGRKLSPTLVYDYPNIDALSLHLAGESCAPASKEHAKRGDDPETIAIIGMSCRLPGAENPEAFWALMRTGTDAVRELAFPRFDSFNLKDRTRFLGGFLTEVDRFEPEFFGIAPREAEKMDPQQRLLLEVSWEALENAGILPARLSGSQSGVFVGISTHDYQRLQEKTGSIVDPYSCTGNALSIAANRLSYFFDLRGPSLAIDTACSSSLVAVHQACQSLRSRECSLALAGGVNLILSPEPTVTLSLAGMLAVDGRCKAFDTGADGFVRSEGCGMVVLKRLTDAQRDQDNVLAVIRGSAVNHDGRSNGLTAPNGPAQRAVIRKALQDAGVPAALLSYVEAHGAGSALGDPIELNALKEVLLEGRSPDHFCWIGSVKTNIGHLEAAGGIAGLIKVVLALQRRQIPANLHFQELNPHICLADTPLRIPSALQLWLANEPRVAGISALGSGGTNAHVIVEEAPAPVVPAAGDSAPEPPWHLLALSAKSAESLGRLADAYSSFVGQHPSTPIGDLSFSANVGRSHFDYRLAFVCDSLESLRQQLPKSADQVPGRGIFRGRLSKKNDSQVAFLFTGQGAQHPQMGRELYLTNPPFRRALEHCAEILQPSLQTGLLEVLYPGDDGGGLLHETVYTQSALFSLEYALCEVWKSWGVEPTVVLGHSLGEYVAACVAGVFSLEDALRLVAARGQLMQTLAGEGAMAAIMASPEEVAAAITGCGDEVSIAAINGPRSVVVSGLRAKVEALSASFQERGVPFQLLQVSHAFHSPLVEAVLDPFLELARKVRFCPPWLNFVSNLYGHLAPEQIASPDYWCRHMREPVQFAAGMQSLRQMGVSRFVEIGPKPVLLGMGRQCLSDSGDLLWLPSLRPGQPDWRQMLESLAQLYVNGSSVDLQGLNRNHHRHRVQLPTYPFRRERYWFKPATKPRLQEQTAQPTVLSPLLDLLVQGKPNEVAQQLEKRFPQEQRKLLLEVVEEMVRQHQSQMAVASLKDCFYQLSWERKARTALTSSSGPSKRMSPGRWLLLADPSSALAQRLASLFEHQGNACHVLSAQGADRLADEFTRSEPLKGIVHLWSLDCAATTDALDAAALQVSCERTLKLVQQLIGANHPTRLWLITRGAVAVDGQQPIPPLALAHAPLWGLGKVLALEHPELWGGLLDLCPQSESAVAESIFAELLDSQGEDQLALRAGERFVARLEPYSLPAASCVAFSLRADATYLITGGCGALGLRTAQWLANHGARFLVLTSRRKTHSVQQREILDQLVAAGVTVEVLAADAADKGAMAQAFDSLSMPVRGVIHAAGVPGYEALKDLSSDALQSVLRPKVQGAWTLHELTKDLPLDFFVCFSSIASLWGSKGQAHYATANYFLDTLCAYRRQLGLPALSINWGPWAGGGMATPEAQRLLNLVGVQTLQPEEALAALGLLLHGNLFQCGVAKVDWGHFQELFALKGRQRLFDHLRSLGANDSAQQPPRLAQASAILQQLQQAPQNERLRLLIGYLRGQVAAILGLVDSNAVDPQGGFFELGMDSLMALELKNRLAADLSLSLPSTIAFDFPNAERLSVFLDRMALHQSALTPSSPSVPRVVTTEAEAALTPHQTALTPALQSVPLEIATGTLDTLPPQVETLIAEKLARLEELAKG